VINVFENVFRNLVMGIYQGVKRNAQIFALKSIWKQQIKSEKLLLYSRSKMQRECDSSIENISIGIEFL